MHQSPVLPPLHMYGILGTPLAQSLSPAIHNRAFASLGHPGAYFAWEKQDSELPAFFEAVRGLPIAGLSVTIPHKRTVMAFLDEISPEARRAGAVNTVFRRNEQLVGDNTDVEGFLWPLRAREAALPSAGLVLGAGGACRAALAGLSALGMTNLVVAARNPAGARALEKDFPCRVIAWEEREGHIEATPSLLLVNATPLGMKGKALGQSPVSARCLSRMAAPAKGALPLVYDLVYNPVETRLLAEARACGVACLDGLTFFAAQASAQLRLWTGASVPVATLRTYADELLRQ